MSYPQWPQELQQIPLVEGFSVAGVSPLKRQSMESGLDRVTRVSSTTVRTNQYTIICNNSQAAVFWDFFDREANMGANFVIIPMVTTNGVLNHVCRFSTFPTQVPDGLEWKVSFSLETDQQHINWS